MARIKIWLHFKFNGLSLDSFILQFALIFNLVVVQAQTQDENSRTVTGASGNRTSEWEATLKLQKLFPVYISGFDEEGRPVVTFQFGRWDFRTFLEEDGSNFDILDKHFHQMVERIYNSPKAFAQSRDVNQFIYAADLEGYDLRQLSHIPTVRICFSFVRNFFRLESQEPRLYKTFGVNGNFVFQSLFSLLKPVLGQFGSLFEMYGTNTAVWKLILFRHIPRSQLPEWLGGFANHTHVQDWG